MAINIVRIYADTRPIIECGCCCGRAIARFLPVIASRTIHRTMKNYKKPTITNNQLGVGCVFDDDDFSCPKRLAILICKNSVMRCIFHVVFPNCFTQNPMTQVVRYVDIPLGTISRNTIYRPSEHLSCWAPINYTLCNSEYKRVYAHSIRFDDSNVDISLKRQPWTVIGYDRKDIWRVGFFNGYKKKLNMLFISFEAKHQQTRSKTNI